MENRARAAAQDHLIADKAYCHPSTRRALRRRGIAHSIPEKRHQRAHRRTRGSAGGRPPKFDRDRYKQRNVVERCFNRLKKFRALATRYAKRATVPDPPRSGHNRHHGRTAGADR